MSAIKETYTTTDLTVILQISRQALEKRAAKEQWLVEARQGRGGGYAYPLKALPEDVKAIIAQHEADKAPKKIIDGAVIPDWSHRIGLARYQVVAAWREFCGKQLRRGVKKTEATEDFLGAYNSGQLLPKVYEIIGRVKKSTLYNWDKTLREHGDDYYSVCDRRGKWDKGGKQGLGQLSPEAAATFLSAWLTPNQLSVTMAYNAMEAVLTKQGLEVPSLASAYRYAHRFREKRYDVYVLRREGEKAYDDKINPSIRRNSNLLDVGDCLFADGHTLNFECLHPVTGRPFRPTLILWFDWKSAMPVGWEIMPTENTVAITSALYMAIVRLGKYPKVAYLDNGRAFKSKFFTGESEDVELLNGLYARLGIGLQFAKPYHARSKVVERFFRDLSEQCARLMPSYTGHNIFDKPAWRARNEKYHQKRHEKEGGIPTLRQAMEVFQAYVVWYGDQPHARIPGSTHRGVFEAGKGPGVNLEELDRHFLWSRRVRPRNCGFTLAKNRYESDTLHGIDHDIVIKFSWADLSVVHLYDLDGQPMGHAFPQVEVNPLASKFGDAHDQAMVADQNRRQASLKKQTMRESRRLDGEWADQPGFKALPFVPQSDAMSVETRALPAPEPVYDLSEEERARLEAVYENAVRDAATRPKIERPLYFQSEWDKYDWLFESSQEGYQLTADDMAFMARYEASDEYQNFTGARYEELKKQYGLDGHEGARQ